MHCKDGPSECPSTRSTLTILHLITESTLCLVEMYVTQGFCAMGCFHIRGSTSQLLRAWTSLFPCVPDRESQRMNFAFQVALALLERLVSITVPFFALSFLASF